MITNQLDWSGAYNLIKLSILSLDDTIYSVVDALNNQSIGTQ